jgi:signal transduction histidine kinase
MDTATPVPPGTAVGPHGPHAPHAPHEWERLVRGWRTAFWGMLSLAVVWLIITTSVSTTERTVGLVAVGVLGAAYAVLMRHPAEEDRWRWLAYLIIAVVVIGVACGVNPALSMLLFIVYSQVWLFTPSLRWGIGFAGALSASALLGFLVQYGFTVDVLRETGPQIAVSLLFSVLLGVWISRVVDESRERAELIRELEAARSELNQAEHARGVMAERERMAREIHDTLAQGFTSIVMLAQAAAAGLAKHPERAAERLTTIEDVARQNLAEARALVAAFSPIDLDGSTLPDAVRRLTERFGAETGLVVDLDVAEGVTRLSRDQEVVLLRAVQEALTNVRRHAEAQRVVVRLLADDERARVEVGDDGVGFAPTDAAAGFGLAGMRGRVSEVGGELDVASTPGGGTRVTVTVPIGARTILGGGCA